MPDDRTVLAVLAAFLVVPSAVMYLTVWVHELGHTVVGRLVGFRVTSVGVGIARPVAWVRVGHTVVFVGTRNAFQGITFADTGLDPSPARLATYLAGGCAANALAAICTFVVVGPTPTLSWWSIAWAFGAVNAGTAAANLIPFAARFGKVRLDTDGARLVNVLRGRPQRFQASLELNTVRVLSGLWRTIGDHDMLAAGLASAAHCWATVRNPDRARLALAEAETLPAAPSNRLALLGHVTRAKLADLEGRPADAEAELDDAAALCATRGAESLRVGVELTRAEARITRGEPADLDALASSPVLVQNPRLGNAYRLLRYRTGDEAAAVAPGLTDPDALVRLAAHLATAERASHAHDVAAVEAAVASAHRSVSELAAELVDPEDRTAVAPLRDYCSARFGVFAPDHTFDSTAIPSPEKVQGGEVIRATERRRSAVGGVAWLFGVVSTVVALSAFDGLRSGTHQEKWAALSVLVYFTLAASWLTLVLIYAVVSVLIRRMKPSADPEYGTRVLAHTGLAVGVSAAIAFGVWLAGP